MFKVEKMSKTMKKICLYLKTNDVVIGISILFLLVAILVNQVDKYKGELRMCEARLEFFSPGTINAK